jgi:Matrixin
MLSILLPAALAWTPGASTWAPEDFPVPYWIAPGFGELEEEAAVGAIQAGFATWATEDCGGIAFAYQGIAEDAVWGEKDGKNVVFFLEDSWPEEASLVSSPMLYSDEKHTVEADFALNGLNYAWATDQARWPSEMDVQASSTHEVGHLLGLWHSTDAEATLNPGLDGSPDARDLAPDDREGLCSLYPTAGSGGQGESCIDESNCGEGMICLQDGGDRYCTATCDTEQPCGEGWTCLEAGGQQVCAAEEAAACGCTSSSGGSIGVGLVGLLSLRRRAARRHASR